MTDIELPKKTERIIKEARELGIADEIQVRNIRIRAEYEALKKTDTYNDRIYKLSKKYNIGGSSIELILSGKNRRKKVIVNSGQ